MLKKNGEKIRLLLPELIVPGIFFLAVTLIFFSRFLFSGYRFIPFQTLGQDPLFTQLKDQGSFNFELGDISALIYPANHLYNTMLHEGCFHYWNTTLLSGHPFMASGTVSFFYPLTLLFNRIFDTATSHGMLLFIHMLIAGCGFYALARNYGLPRASSLLAGLSWMLSGQMTTWLEYGHVAGIYAFAPLVMLSLRKSIGSGSIKWALTGGFFLGLSLLVGAIQFNYYLILFIIAYSVFRVFLDFSSALRIALNLLVILVMAFCFAAPQLLSQVELAAFSQRSVFSFHELRDGYSSPLYSYLLRLIAPDIMGNPALGFHLHLRGVTFYQEICIYGGIVTFLFALLAFKSGEKERWFFFVVCGITLLWAACTWFFFPFFKVLPVLNKVLPGRIVFLFLFSLSLLAGFGFASFERQSSDMRLMKSTLVIITGFFVLLLLLCAWLQVEPERFMPMFRTLLPKARFLPDEAPVSPGAGNYIMTFLTHMVAYYNPVNLRLFIQGILSLVILVILLMEQKQIITRRHVIIALLSLAAVDLLSFGMRYNTMSRQGQPPIPPVLAAIEDAHKGNVYRILRLEEGKNPNIASLYGFNEVEGCSGLYPASYAELMGALQSRFDTKNQIIFGNYVVLSSCNSPILDMLNVRFIITHPAPLAQNPLLKEVAAVDGHHVYEKKTYCPRFFLISRYISAPRERIRELLLSPAFKPDTIAFLEKEPLFPEAMNTPEPEAIHILHMSPDSSLVDVRLEQKSILVFSDNYYPGWHAMVNEKPAEILRVNYTLKGVALPPGIHRVLFYYKPTYLDLSIVLACTALLILIASLIRRDRSAA